MILYYLICHININLKKIENKITMKKRKNGKCYLMKHIIHKGFYITRQVFFKKKH